MKNIFCAFCIGVIVTMIFPASGFSKKKQILPCKPCENLDGFISPLLINDDIRKMVGKYKGGKGPENVAVQKARGVIETGLIPRFINNGNCPQIDSEKWAIDYTSKRSQSALHKGIDIPQKKGTPILAVADGVVVGKFINKNNRKGIEIMLRHRPDQTGLPFWTYSQYTHLKDMSPLTLGEKVKLGEEIGKTSNTGKMGKRIRRDALHFAILYSSSPEWSNDGWVVTPKNGYFMDPSAFYRLEPPYASQSVKNLPKKEKYIPTPYMMRNKTLIPANTKRIWPYLCK